MKIEEILGGFRIILTNDESKLLNKIKESKNKQLFKEDMDDWDKQLAFKMCSKGLLKRIQENGKIIYKPNAIQKF